MGYRPESSERARSLAVLALVMGVACALLIPRPAGQQEDRRGLLVAAGAPSSHVGPVRTPVGSGPATTSRGLGTPSLAAMASASAFEVCAGDDVPPAVRAAFEFAGVVWGRRLATTVPVMVEIRWRPLGEVLLANAVPAHMVLDEPGLPRSDVLYPVALANQLTGRDLAPGPCDPGPALPGQAETADILVEVNASLATWHLGLDGRVPQDRIELLSVALHEVAHGLGLSSASDARAPARLGRRVGEVRVPNIYDLHLVRGGDGRPLTELDEHDLGLALRSGDVGFDGAHVRDLHGGPVALHAPAEWDPGTSISHLDPDRFDGTDDLLLRPHTRYGTSPRPTPLTFAMLADLGWEVRPVSPSPGP